MPLSDELIDERVRSSLEDLRTGPIDVAGATGIVRKRAATRLRWRKAAAGLGVAAVIVVVAGVSIALQDHDRSRVDTAPAQTPETTTEVEYGFAPAAPLLDEPLGDVPATVVTVIGDQTFSASVVDGMLGMKLSDGIRAGSSSGDQMRAAALDHWGSMTPGDGGSLFVLGATRAEVERVDLAFGDRAVISQPTIRVAAFPTIRFFIFEVAPEEEREDLTSQMYVISAYDADGRLLTDSARFLEEAEAFEEAMDARAGLEVRQASILDAGPTSVTDNGLVLRVFACGGEPMPMYSETAETVLVSATVKVPVGVGDCTSGATVEINIGLDAPLGERRVIDSRTGEEIPRQP